MQQKSFRKFTFQTRFKTSFDQDQKLLKSAFLLSKIERLLFKDLYQNKKELNELKAAYIKKYQINRNKSKIPNSRNKCIYVGIRYYP